jgi:hypothetical protein
VSGGRGLKAGDLVSLPGGRTAVVESVTLNGHQFTDTFGAPHYTADAELAPLAPAASAA